MEKFGGERVNHENNKCLIISEAVQVLSIKFVVKIGWLKVYIISYFFSPMSLLFSQGHNCVSNMTILLTCTIIAISQTVFKLWHSNLDDLVLDFDARSQWVGRGKKSMLNYLDNCTSNKHFASCDSRSFFLWPWLWKRSIWQDHLVLLCSEAVRNATVTVLCNAVNPPSLDYCQQAGVTCCTPGQFFFCEVTCMRPPQWGTADWN